MSSYRQVLYHLVFRTKYGRKTLAPEHSRDLMRDIKASSSHWLKQSGKFPDFTGWADGYGAFTYAWRNKDMIINYIKNQQEHHRKKTYETELKKLLKEQGIKVDEKYFP